MVLCENTEKRILFALVPRQEIFPSGFSEGEDKRLKNIPRELEW